MAITKDSESEVEIAVTQDTKPGPDPNALFLGKHFATYTDFKAAMCRWAVAAHSETWYEKSERLLAL